MKLSLSNALTSLLAIICGVVIFFTFLLSTEQPPEARTVITVNGKPLNGFTWQNLTTTTAGIATVRVKTLESPVTIGSSLSLRNYSGILQRSADSGATWTTLGGSGRAVLKTTAHTGVMASATTTWGATWEGSFQVAAHVKRDEADVAEDVLSFYAADYGCHVFQIGFDATNHARLTYATTITGVPGNYTCTTTTLTSADTYPADQWVELAIQKNGDSVYFFKNGIVETAQTGAAVRDSPPTLPVTARLFEGFQGEAASLKVGTTLTWPTTGARLIDANGAMTPGAYWLFSFSEGVGTTTAEHVTGTAFTLNDATWDISSPILF